MTSATRAIARGDLNFAYQELAGAAKLRPDDLAQHIQMGNLYMRMCVERAQYCDETVLYMDSMLKPELCIR